MARSQRKVRKTRNSNLNNAMINKNNIISEETKLWRYMDLAKFLMILEKKSLFFSRADKFSDRFEGSYTKKSIESRQYFKEPTDDELRQISEIYNNFRKNTYINCWHQNQFESEAMWNIYSQSNEAIAIQTTIGKIKKAIDLEGNNITLKKVEYIDYNSNSNDLNMNGFLIPFFYKRKSFEHEKEVRMIIQRVNTQSVLNSNLEIEQLDLYNPISEYGISVDIDTSILIESIYISPLAPSWFYLLVKDLLKRYNIDCKVNQSELNESPNF